ncbi:hypothetical protein QZH41_002800 [Actinostola sp. cb2023]|nr:hypothetical protein QZH41_002800 [Actinostola sp. cb2023]
MAQSKPSFIYDDTSNVWLQPLSIIINCLLPIEFIYGDWFERIAESEERRSNPESLGSLLHDEIETGSRVEGFGIPQFLVPKTDDVPVGSERIDVESYHWWEPDFDLMRSNDFLIQNHQQKFIPIFTVEHVEATYFHQLKEMIVILFLNGGLNNPKNPHRVWSIDMHGPVKKLQSKGGVPDYEEDKTAVFKYPQAWPEPAMEWLVRPRPGSWPSPELVQDVFESGCHIAPVGRGTREQDPMDILQYVADPTEASTSKQSPDSPGESSSSMDETEWRLSFSVAENKLGQSVTPVQRHIIVLLKMLKKMYFPDVISSYHLKNLFWEIEKQEESFWREDNSAKCLVYMLDRLQMCLEDGCLPHYVVPESNLLQYEETRKLDEAAALIRDVRKSILTKSTNMLKRIWSVP